jgi:hypothetical protein
MSWGEPGFLGRGEYAGDREEGTTLDVVCAWCGVSMGTKDGEGETGTTTGICDGCNWRHFGIRPPWLPSARTLRRRAALGLAIYVVVAAVLIGIGVVIGYHGGGLVWEWWKP